MTLKLFLLNQRSYEWHRERKKGSGSGDYHFFGKEKKVKPDFKPFEIQTHACILKASWVAWDHWSEVYWTSESRYLRTVIKCSKILKTIYLNALRGLLYKASKHF